MLSRRILAVALGTVGLLALALVAKAADDRPVAEGDKDKAPAARGEKPRPPASWKDGEDQPPGDTPRPRRGGYGFGPGPPQGSPQGPPQRPEPPSGGPPGPPFQPGPPGGQQRPGGPPGPSVPFSPPRPDWGSLQEQDPEMFRLLRLDDDLDRQARDLAMSYRRAPEEGRAKIKATINDLVNKQFDARQQRRLLEVKRLEEDLKRLREAIDRRKESRDTLVKKRVAQLIGDDEELNF